ncbi:MAG TPA: hypothetical protein VF160_09330 [Candidatus Dormibacteraeota bacterium]
MKKRPVSNPRVTCGSCRRFDGYAWCHHWNFHTERDSPICDHYRPQKPASAGDVAPLQKDR